MQKYYSLVKNSEKREADLTIFGDITSYPWLESDVSSANLSKQLEELGDVDTIHVRINSYGGEVAEGLAIYNALKNHKAKVKTYCYGFACSIASVIFMAGEERLMSTASLLMIHNAWTFVSGNAAELRKQADDLDKITQASINAYMQKVNITEEELKTLMDSEHWLEYTEAVEKGFATGVYDEEESDKASQSVKKNIIKMLLKQEEEKDMYKCTKCGYIHEGDLPEFFICPECGAGKEDFVELDDDGTMGQTDDPNKDDDPSKDPSTDPDKDDGKQKTDDPNKDDDKTKQEGGVMYECTKCGYIHEGELPEYFMCPECGAPKEAFVKVEEEPPQEETIMYECGECGYIHEGELPEFFICPECGADKEAFTEIEQTENDDSDGQMTDEEKKKANAKAANFFATLAGGIE